MRWRDSLRRLKLSNEVDVAARWIAEREGGLALMMRYRKVSLAQDVHAYQGVDVWAERKAGNAHHAEQNSVWEADVDQVAGCRVRPAGNAYVHASD
jgi:hypothetical protein